MALTWLWRHKLVQLDFARFAATWPAPAPANGQSQIVERCTPSEVDTLGRYNAERARGVLHTVEWQQRMAELQRRFDAARGGRT